MLKGTQRDQQQRVVSENQGSRLVQAASVLRGYENREALSSPKPEDRISLFWRVFGGTLLSIAALVCITLYQQFTSTISELRNNLNNLNQSRGDLVKNDDFNTRMTSLWGTVKELEASTVVTSALKERSELMEQQLKAGEEERKDMAHEIQQMRERLAVLEARQAVGAPSVPTTKDSSKAGPTGH
ncbi:MAG TPA: hypothetical protein VK395_16985 [Gemmataceae bacterium]|nr:hypothetical protein [Gemmataceae bacterium]